jgi:predicted nucleic acid-binding protein
LLKKARHRSSEKRGCHHENQTCERRVTIEKLGFQENDLWIAAIAKCHRFTIVSTDSDFERIKEVEELFVENWLLSDPEEE